MKMDIFPHILEARYKEALHKEIGPGFFKSLRDSIPTLSDLNYRFRIIESNIHLLLSRSQEVTPANMRAGTPITSNPNHAALGSSS